MNVLGFLRPVGALLLTELASSTISIAFSSALAPCPQRPPAQIPISTRSHLSTSREVRAPLTALGWEAVGERLFIAAQNLCLVPSVVPCFHTHGATDVNRDGRGSWGLGWAKVAWLGVGTDPGLHLQSPREAAHRASTSSKTSSSSPPSSLQPSHLTPTSQPRLKPTIGHAPRRWRSWVGDRVGEGWAGPRHRLIVPVKAP